MLLKTRVFELLDGRYRNLTEVAAAMEISVSQIYRVRQGKRNINQKFFIGAVKAFPEYRIGELFYLVPISARVARSHQPRKTLKSAKPGSTR